MVDEILKYADNYIGLTIKSEIDSNSLLNKDNTSDEIKTEFKEEAIAYIFSKEILSEMIRAIATFENEKNKFVFKQKSFNNLRAKSEAIYQDLNEQYKIIKELVEKGILPQNEEISAKQNLITLERTQTSDLAEFENEEYNLKNATLDLITKIYNLSEKLEVKPSGPSTIISTLLKSSEYVSEGQVASIVSTTNNTENPKNITAVFPLTSLQGISNGLEVLVSPVNTNVNSYGSIKGKIKTLNKVPIDKTNAIYIVGSQARADELFSNYKTMTFAELTLKAKDTISGYEWSSSNGPSYSIPIGTEASVKVITESKRPISILLPFLRGLTGRE
jgi:HlyD family secretion protein